MSFRVQFSNRAKRDVREIASWIKSRSSKGAISWLNALEMSVTELSKNAMSSTPAPEVEDVGIDLRQRLFKTRRGNTYRLVFIIREKDIQVLTVRGTGQDLLTQSDLDISE